MPDERQLSFFPIKGGFCRQECSASAVMHPPGTYATVDDEVGRSKGAASVVLSENARDGIWGAADNDEEWAANRNIPRVLSR
jgi:hypothetical protein